MLAENSRSRGPPGADGLAALVRKSLGHDPFCGTIFIFRSKRADRLKILAWDGSGRKRVAEAVQALKCQGMSASI
jgi:transposase